MVKFRVDIKWLVVRFPERRKLSSYQIKGYIKKSVSKRLFSMVIDSLSFLNKAMIFFLMFFPIHFHYYYY